MNEQTQSLPRVAALVGPAASGKTSLFEALLLATGALRKKGNIQDHTTVGDASAEAKARGTTLELAAASSEYLGEQWTFIDCPGNVEFAQDVLHGLMVADVAVVVVDPDPARAPAASAILHFLDDRRIPHVIFINKVDLPGSADKVRDTVAALQTLSARPLLLRELPIREGENVTGFVDLVSERAYGYRGHDDTRLAKVPADILSEETEVRQKLLENLADLDDHLLTELLDDVAPPAQEVYANLRKDLQADLIVEVFFGSAEQDHGIQRLLKALRHEAPEATETALRLELPGGGGLLVQSFKTLHAPHVGKLSLVRIWRGEVVDGQTLNGNRVSGLYRMLGSQQVKQPKAGIGEIVALGHLDNLRTGQGVRIGGAAVMPWVDALQPVAALCLRATKTGDEVKLSGALAKLSEEDPSLTVEYNPDTHEQVLWGQGDIHLRNALDRLKSRFGLEVRTDPPQVPYRETIRKSTSQHGRFKHQSGGHGAFGDVVLDISPLPRGSGFEFHEEIVGGVVPRQFFPSVEKGIREFMKQGPLGYPLVDFKAVLTHGSFHPVDSSDSAFQAAARVAMVEGLPACNPVLLEPVIEVQLFTPSEHTARVQRMVTGRRGGQLQGFDRRDGWSGWDVVQARLPQSELQDLITELRSLTQGIGTFKWKFHHLQEVDGKEADRVVEQRKQELADARG